jgi:NTE family protein
VSTDKRRVAIACQGGGSHTAFTAGALSRLLQPDVLQDHRIVGLSGTSGGAICAAIAWSALLHRRPEDAERLLMQFWAANSASSWPEQLLNTMVLWGSRAAETVAMPTLSPYLNPGSAWASAQLRTLIEDTVDLRADQQYATAVAQAVDTAKPPMLLLGAVDVLNGRFRTFDSRRGDISAEAIMASAAIPTIFRSVRIDKRLYWDGLFSQNPPVHDLLKPGPDELLEDGPDELLKSRPDELWVLQVNPSRVDAEPTLYGDIETRRNELAGNLSLRQELGFIETVNRWLDDGSITPSKFKHITVRILEMRRTPRTEAFGYASKLNRDPSFIAELLELGQTQAQEQIEALRFEQAWDDQDLGPVLDRFAEGAVASSTHPMAPLPQTSNRHEIRAFFQEFGPRVETCRARVCKEAANWTVHATSDHGIQARVRVRFVGGKIDRLTVTEP